MKEWKPAIEQAASYKLVHNEDNRQEADLGSAEAQPNRNTAGEWEAHGGG